MIVFKAVLVLAAFVVVWATEYATLSSGGARRRDIITFTIVTAVSLAICLVVLFELPVPNPADWITKMSEWIMSVAGV